MRVWDIHPGYLNRNSLLGEHAEVHSVLGVVLGGRKGFGRHPETMRWRGRLPALRRRHDLIVCEMALRGYRHHSAVTAEGVERWPETFVHTPAEQFAILRRKYEGRPPGRIPLPETCGRLWVQHEYSMLARETDVWAGAAPDALSQTDRGSFEELALHLVDVLRRPPTEVGLAHALRRIWDAVARFAPQTEPPELGDLGLLLGAVQELALEHRVRGLLESTALSELGAWLAGPLESSPRRSDARLAEPDAGEERDARAD